MKRNVNWKWIFGLGLLILILVLVFSLLNKKSKGVRVAIESVTERSITEVVNTNGKIYPQQEVKISADASGEVIDLLVKEGDTVKAGQILLRIQPELYEGAVDQAAAAVNISNSNLGSSRAEIKRLEIQQQQAQTAFDRSKRLYDQGVIAKVDFENAKSTYESAVAAISAAIQNSATAKYNVQSSQAGFKQAKTNLNKTTIYAPMSGVVSKLNVEKGERVLGTIQMAGTEIMRIANFGGFEAKVTVGENDVMRVHLGDTAIVEVDAYPDRKFKGVVSEIANSSLITLADATSSSTNTASNYELKIKLLSISYLDIIENNPLPFRPGMSCSAGIHTKTISNALSIPIQSVTTREEITDSLSDTNDDQYKEMVFVVRDDKCYLVSVETGIQNTKYIEITKGLKLGDKVISAPYSAISKTLNDSSQIEIVDKKELFEQKK